MSSTPETAATSGGPAAARTAAPAPRGSSPMDPEAMADHLRERLGDAVVDVAVAFGQLTLTVEAHALPEAARLCKESPALDFNFWDHNAGVDLGEEGFAVVTHLYSLRHGHHIMLRVVAPGGREQPKVPTLTHLYRGADWHEREVYDMFGVDFEGHPGLLPRLLTVEHFEGFPLRKDFLLSTREAKPWPGLKEPKEVGEQEDGSDPEAAAGERPSEEAADATASEAPVAPEEKEQAAETRAERAGVKSEAMRADKQSEQAAAQTATTGEAEDAGSADAGDEPDAQAAAAQETTGGETAGAGAAQVAAAAGEPEPQTPEGAADVANSDIAKDAAAGAVGGDTAAGASGDAAGDEQPVHDPKAEAKIGEGAPAAPSGAPGAEVEGRHGGAERESHSQPTADEEAPGDEEARDDEEAREDEEAATDDTGGGGEQS